ncbi:MAG: alpha/beta hydrolase [Burkholderiales bacterium]|nr:alpha/beta hydrolase [Burkholderiales bacterium]
MKVFPLLAIAASLALSTGASALQLPVPPGAKNVVIVPGAFVDGSGWREVHDLLWIKGYHVTIVHQPHTTLDEDVAAVREVINQQDGPVVLVGHSLGGSVISLAGDRDKVKALVYVAGFEPDVGESVSQLLGSMPAANSDVKSTRDGHAFLDPAKFRADFAADLTPNRTNFMADSQVPAARAVFDGKSWTAAWHKKPSWAVLTTEDHALSPDLQRRMYERAGSKVTEVKASHAVYMSQPLTIANVIDEAALSVKPAADADTKQ